MATISSLRKSYVNTSMALTDFRVNNAKVMEEYDRLLTRFEEAEANLKTFCKTNQRDVAIAVLNKLFHFVVPKQFKINYHKAIDSLPKAVRPEIEKITSHTVNTEAFADLIDRHVIPSHAMSLIETCDMAPRVVIQTIR